MDSIFNENNYYWCIHCEQYSMDLISEYEGDHSLYRVYECVCCYEKDFETLEL